MKDHIKRLIQFAEYYNVNKPSEFSKKTGINHQSSSNYLKGSSMPGFEALMKIKESFEELNINWLLTGKGEMLKQDKEETNQPSIAIGLNDKGKKEDLFSPTDSDMLMQFEFMKTLTEANLELQREVLLMRGNRTDYMSALGEITNSLKTLSANVDKLGQTVNDLSGTVNDLSGRVQQLDVKVDRIDKRLVDVEDRLDRLEGKKKDEHRPTA